MNTPYLAVSDARLYTIWGITLGVAAVVVLVVAALLLLILAAARNIERHAGRALAAVEQIDRDTKVIWAIDDVNRVATDILVTTRAIQSDGGEIADALSGRVRTGGTA